MYGTQPAPRPAKKGNKRLAALLTENSSDDDADMEDSPSMPDTDSSGPWMREFNSYLKLTDEVPSGMTLVVWWGVSLYIHVASHGR